ncbi:lysozyme-like [Gigantopelta aegis]|uniref:lysozyme-like n=1 Tax=Gigantopelta aegis TaxID=1735272 RepID=UPI001B88A0F1|nr:lysozyme-like [Gigantopelta aegis]
MWRFLVLLVGTLGVVQAGISDKCLACICQVETHCKYTPCHPDVGSLSCGPYQIKEPYWEDCYKPGKGWKPCALDFQCAAKCVRSYTGRYGQYCTGGRIPTCEDYARIHNGGPLGCRKKATLGYWERVKKCLEKKPDYRLLWSSLYN